MKFNFCELIVNFECSVWFLVILMFENFLVRTVINNLNAKVRNHCDICDICFFRTILKKFFIAICVDKLREHILRIHAKDNTPSKNNKIKTFTQNDDLKRIQDCSSAEDLNDDKNLSLVGKECLIYSDRKTIEPDESHKEDAKVSGKPKFQPKVPPTDYERFIYKCEHCMLGFKRRGKPHKQ